MKTKVGWVITVLVSAFLCFSASGKFAAPTDEIAKGLQHVGVDVNIVKTLGILEILVALIYLIPQSTFIGAILVTGYMGGAIFTHLRVGDPFFIQALVPVFAWIGLGLRRYPEIASLLGIRKPMA
jgi:hypothetical protein